MPLSASRPHPANSIRQRPEHPRRPTAGPAAAGAAAAILTAAVTLCAAACLSPRVKVERVNEPLDVSTDFPLHTEHWAEPKIVALRRQEGLDHIVEGAPGDFDRFLRLQTWTRAQWPVGDPDPYPPCNGIDILAAIRSGRTGGFCGQYSYLLADAMKSLGYFSVRYVELENPQGDSHFVVETWSNQHDRWVVLDPTYNVHYVDGARRPLNALELHDAYLTHRLGDVVALEGKPPPLGGKRINELPDRGIDYYARFAVSTRSDLAHLNEPLSLADREKMFVRYDDPRGGAFKNLKFVLATSRSSDLYPGVAQVDARVVKIEGAKVLVEFATRGSLPHFLAYQVRLDGGAWRRCSSGLEWEVPFGEHLLEVSAVNVAGVSGPVFRLRASR